MPGCSVSPSPDCWLSRSKWASAPASGAQAAPANLRLELRDRAVEGRAAWCLTCWPSIASLHSLSLSSADGNDRFMAKFTSSRANACAISRDRGIAAGQLNVQAHVMDDCPFALHPKSSRIDSNAPSTVAFRSGKAGCLTSVKPSQPETSSSLTTASTPSTQKASDSAMSRSATFRTNPVKRTVRSRTPMRIWLSST